MKNIEKLERVLTKELVEKNVDIIARIQTMRFGRIKVKDSFARYIATNGVSIDYVFSVNEGGTYQPLRLISLHTKIGLAELDEANDSSQEQDILAYIVYSHINSLEKKIKQELDKLDFENKYIREAKEKVQKQLDKNKVKGEFGFKDGNLYVSSPNVRIMNTPYKPEVLVTPDGVEFGGDSLTITKPIPLEKVLLGSLTLQEKDGKLAITYADGSTRYIK